MDPRPYFFVKIGKNWSFIATDTTYESNMLPIEFWEIDGKKFVFCRVAYKHEKATYFCSRGEDGMGLMEGPDIYTLIDEKNNTLVSVWKPSIPNTIEIASNFGTQSSMLVTEDSTLEQIRNNIFGICKFEPASVKITERPHNYYHILKL